ncbi:TetR/AcrR family transcriptional regulator [Streptomyces sp. NPDC001941]|uniref:TetR/AcrR family transcriptional regulator n=1 Tax=Streptomyces sp. NPDC001941 TaxID=3154659 RepID=UPI0033174C2C
MASERTDGGDRTGSPRERYRAQVRAEVLDHARAQIAEAGLAALSLNAIAKRMGLSGPALYRYFAGRDELLTALVKDAYQSLADALRAANSPPGGLAALARAFRAWALADPHRYFLLYGTPLPGYRAPDDTTAVSRRIMRVLLDACAAAGAVPASGAPVVAHLDEHRAWAQGHPAPPEVLHRALTFWTRLHGLLSLELAGQFAGMGFDPEVLYAAEVDALTGRRDA